MLEFVLFLLISSGLLFYISNYIQREWMKRKIFIESNSMIVVAIFMTLLLAYSCDNTIEELKKIDPEVVIKEIKELKND